MSHFFKEQSLTYDDVCIAPTYSNISSRLNGEIDTTTRLGPLTLGIPLVSANMADITEHRLASAINKLGGLGILHRFMSAEKTIEELQQVEEFKAISVGVGNAAEQYLETIISCLGYRYLDVICIDVAHGHHQAVSDMISYVKKRTMGEVAIIAGNVCTAPGALFLEKAGADIIKVGVSPGSICATRIVTGVGLGQVTAIKEIVSAVKKTTGIIADGGAKYSGDITKAVALGADAVMSGFFFAGCEECPGEIIEETRFSGGEFPRDVKTGKKFKCYRGSASLEVQEQWRGTAHVVEGIESRVPYKGPAGNVVNELMKGFRSGMSYVGARTIQELRNNSVFVTQTQNSYIEGLPRV